MISIFLKTFIMYVILLCGMRILGKRQLGELEISELTSTILISEIASAPITNTDISILEATVPLFVIIFFEFASSILLSRFTKLKNIFSVSPSALIFKGKINQKEMRKNRISPEELISELRLKNITDPSHVEYAILEQNGKLSVFEKKKVGERVDKSQFCYAVITDGVISETDLTYLGFDKNWVESKLKKKGLTVDKIFLMTVSPDGKTNIIVKEEK